VAQGTEIVFIVVENPDSILETSVAPLGVEVESNLETLLVEFLYLTLYIADARVCAANFNLT
jgi:hypothetical protein